jgi:hypothetical protein
MRVLRILGSSLLVLAALTVAVGKENKLGVREVNQISFDAPVHVGSALLPAGDYVVRHTMEGQDHVMVFKNSSTKQEFKAKCTLVPLALKVPRTEASYQLNASKEKVLIELQFRGDTAKHVF